jgi:hypothetical protein
MVHLLKTTSLKLPPWRTKSKYNYSPYVRLWSAAARRRFSAYPGFHDVSGDYRPYCAYL